MPIKKKKQSEIIKLVQYFDDVTSLQIVLAIHNSGVTLNKCYYNSGEGIKENLLSAALSVITTFESEIEDQLGMDCEDKSGRIHTIDYRNFSISIFFGGLLRLGILTNTSIGSLMKEKCKDLIKQYEIVHNYDLKNFTGDIGPFNDFHEIVDKELDGKLNKKCIINIMSLNSFDAPKNVKKVFSSMHSMEDEIYPKNIPSILKREAKINLTEAKYYTYDAYISYVLEPTD
ncbi:MAG: hypothetical protein ACTSPD_18130 [Promethearchaeota archaeon]